MKTKKIKQNRNGNFFLNLIRYLTYLIFFTPLIVNGNYFFPFVGPKSLFFMGVAEIIFFSWLVLIYIDAKYRPKPNFLFYGLLVYLFVLILAAIFGVNPSYSFWSKYERMTGILMHLHLFAFFLVLSSTFKEDDFKKFFAFSVFIAEIAGLYGVLNVKNPAMRGGGTLGNESFLGTYLLFNLFFSLYLIFKTDGFLRKFSLVSFFILFFSILFTGVNLQGLPFSEKISAILYASGARAAKISFYLGLVLFFFLWLAFSKNKVLKTLAVSVLFFSFIFSFYFIFSVHFLPQSVPRKLFEREVGSFGGRLIVWQSALRGFFQRPILGWGPENFEFSFFKNYNPCFGTEKCGSDTWYDRAHNVIFDTLVTTGILGLVSYFFVFLSAVFILWQNLKKDFLPFGVFFSLFAAYFIQNLTVFDMVSSFLMLFLSLSFVASLKEGETKFSLPRTPNPYFLLLVFLVFFFTFYNFIYLPLLSERGVILASFSTPFSEKRLEFFKRALISPLGKFQIRQSLAENSLENFRRQNNFQNIEGIKKEFDFLIEELKKSINECSLDFRARWNLGQIYNSYSLFDKNKLLEGERIMRETIEMFPKNQKGYWVLTQNLIFQEKFDEAIEIAQKAVDLEPQLETSHFVLIQTLKFSKKEDLAKEKIKEAIQINPQLEKDFKNLFP